MRRRLTGLVMCGAAVVAVSLYYAEGAGATPSNSGFSNAFVVKGATFNEFAVFNWSPKKSLPVGNDDPFWLSFQQTKGKSDLYVVSNTWQPANYDGNGSIASTGWHTHPGHSLIIVTAGTLTEYEGDCSRHVYNAGDTFVDPGGNHVHIIRNEGSVAASTIAVQTVPYDPNKANRRIDAPAPENCQDIK
jgi:hypothetical protein